MNNNRLKPYGLIGRGRVARSFEQFLRTQKIPYKVWHRDLGLTPSQALEGCGTVLVLINDDAIETFIQSQLSELKCDYVVHCSGALNTALANSWHPLTAFPLEALSAKDFSLIPFVGIEGGPDFSEVFPGFKNPHFVIKPEQKAFYHAACVMAGNFPTLLWSAFLNDLSGLNLPSAVGLAYIERIYKNFVNSPNLALTGPIARNDQSTLQKNQDALVGDSRLALYQAFVKTFACASNPTGKVAFNQSHRRPHENSGFSESQTDAT